MNSSPGAASAAYDLQFIDTMIAHHQSAVSMAEMAAMKASHADLKAFAERIVADQRSEIDRMKEWRGQWYQAAPAAENMDLPGMMESMQGMNMEHMKNMSGPDFDGMFLDMMIPHHQGAIVMAREALGRADHQDLKTLAQQIIDNQQKEIETMTDWKTKWRSGG